MEARSVWRATRKFAEETLGWEVSERRIFSISYRHDGMDYYVEVGEPDPRIGELVLVILESNTYLVCTPNRGVLRGMPILVGQNEVKRIIDFRGTLLEGVCEGRFGLISNVQKLVQDFFPALPSLKKKAKSTFPYRFGDWRPPVP